MTNNEWNGIPRNEVPWFPTIDPVKCTKCGHCVNFCSHGTYELNEEQPEVKNPFNCVVGCSGCLTECPAGAISFPPLSVLGEVLNRYKK